MLSLISQVQWGEIVIRLKFFTVY